LLHFLAGLGTSDPFKEFAALSPHFVTNFIFSLLQHLSFPRVPSSRLRETRMSVSSLGQSQSGWAWIAGFRVSGRWIIEVGLGVAWIIEMSHRMIEIGMRIRWSSDEAVDADIAFVQELDIDLDVQCPFEDVVQLDVRHPSTGIRYMPRQADDKGR
jgi:hypothetical protein